MLDIIKSATFGVVEGITEWLPVSSTGHMIILDQFLSLDQPTDFVNLFLVVIQLGAILAIVVSFWRTLWPFRRRKQGDDKSLLDRNKLSLWLKILVACVPAAVVGLLCDDYFEKWFYNATSVAIALIVFGVAFIVVERINKKRQPKVTELSQITIPMALAIGMFQLVAAIFPGTSRSGATIVGALMLGVSRTVAAEFTFCLAVPVMVGASALKIMKYGLGFTGVQIAILLVGMLVAFVVSLVVVKWLMKYIKRHDFQVFGWYRIGLGLLVLALGAMSII